MTSRARDTIVVVPCSGEKQKVPCMAVEMYVGQLHQLAMGAARALIEPEQIRILSGKHGLLRLTDELWPYEQRIDEPGHVETSVLVEQLHAVEGLRTIVSLCPKAYTTALQQASAGHRDKYRDGFMLRAPLTGVRGIGDMRQRLASIRRRGRL